MTSQVVEVLLGSPSSTPLAYSLELRSGRRLCPLSVSMSQDEQPGASTLTIPPPQAAPSVIISGHQRDPHLFAGLRGEDAEDWLDDYERVSSANRWDDPHKLRHVSFYLTGVAKTWFFNHEVDFTDWTNFKQQLRQVFGTPAVRSALAKKTLDARKQHSGESYTSYIEDVLALCRRVNVAMAESDRIRHILKGIGTVAFNALAVKNPATVADIVLTCQRLDELESVRLQPDFSEHRSAADPDLRMMIRAIIREELQSFGLSSSLMIPAQPSGAALRDVIREELASMTCSANVDPPAPRTVPTYAQVAAAPPTSVRPTLPLPTYTQVGVAPPANVPSIPIEPSSPHLTALSHSAPSAPYYPPWRPSRPTCYYCGYRGHISRFCRKRQQDERRGYDLCERDAYSGGASYQSRRYASPPRRSPSPPATTETPNGYRTARRRSPSPFRRSSSPLRPASFTSDRRPEN